MKVGEMLQWTKRFHSICSGYPGLKEQRLANMMMDLERAYDITAMKTMKKNLNPFVMLLYYAVAEERRL